MTQLSLTLFGAFSAAVVAPGAEKSQGDLRLPTDKTRALLVYLALTPDVPLRREALSALLWSEQPESMARQNLRKTLARLRKALNGHGEGFADVLLAVTRNTIELHAAACTADVTSFLQQLEDAQTHTHDVLWRCLPCLKQIETAIDLYRQGDFLAGLSLPDAEPFEAWVRARREELHRRQSNALQTLSRAYDEQGRYEKARHYARLQIEQEPWHEEAHRHLMLLLAGQGQRAEAIAQYQTCRQILKDELGVEPSPETEQLLTQIMDGSLLVVPPSTRRTLPRRLPQLPGPLIGRKREIGEVLRLLGNPACRLLTLTGPGGVGKTSLALALAHRLSQEEAPFSRPDEPFGDGIYFVSLAGTSDAEQLPVLVAEALELALHNRHSVARQVEQVTRDKSLLLIVDNLEHLLPDLAWLRRLSAFSPHLKMLVTSREPLNWQGEWRYSLEGLSYPQGEDAGKLHEAVQLFVQAARQVQPDFRYTPDNGPEIARICRFVHGWPLALQMAAGWVRVMSCQAIAEQIRSSLDLLTSSLRDVPPRQRSMRVVFEHTWTSLSEEERDMLVQLAVFQGGFSQPSAKDVTAITPHLLLSLADKSLVQVDKSAGRYHLHDLLRQFALEKAQSREETHRLARANHGRYYLQWIVRQGQRLRTVEFQPALENIKIELENVRQAWRWAAANGEAELLHQSMGHLARFFESAGLSQESVTFFRRALERLDQHQAAELTSLKAQLLYHIIESMGYMGQYDEVEDVAGEALSMAQEAGDVSLVNLLLILQAHFFREQGHYEQAQTSLQEAITFSREHDNPEGVARALRIQGNTYWSVAAYEKALQCYEEARHIRRLLQQTTAESLLTGNIGTVFWRLGRYREALKNYEVALTAHRRVGDASSIAVWKGNIGLVYIDLQEDERALAYLDEALKMHTQLGRKFYKIELLLGKTALFLRRGDIQTAIQCHRQALEIAQQIGNRTYLLDCDLWQARLYIAQNRIREAIQLLQLLLVREFRPNLSALIFEELSAALAQKRGSDLSSPGASRSAQARR